MPNVFDNNVLACQAELHAKISGSQSVMPREFSPQRLSSADGRPFLKAVQKPVHTTSNRLRQAVKFFLCQRCETDHTFIMTRYDNMSSTNMTTEQLTGITVVCRDFAVHSVTVGKDAQGEVLVQVEHNGQLYRGRAVSTDSIEASAKAFLNAINRIAAIGTAKA
jgi:phosphoribosylformylglycinamidine (FGAM) synthase-like enzyme